MYRYNIQQPPHTQRILNSRESRWADKQTEQQGSEPSAVPEAAESRAIAEASQRLSFLVMLFFGQPL
jgi:hypothetical protein